MRLQHLLILQNKIDLIREAAAREQFDQIKRFVQGTVAEKAPVIPISAQLKYNIEVWMVWSLKLGRAGKMIWFSPHPLDENLQRLNYVWFILKVVCEYICKKIPVPLRDFTSEPRLIVIRSFDVNKPGSEVSELKGGVAGGSILRGEFIFENIG